MLLLGIVWFDTWLDTVRLTGTWQTLFAGKDHLPRGLALLILALIVAPLAARELALIVERSGIMVRRWLITLAAVLGLLLSYAIPMGLEVIDAVAVVATGLIVLFILSIVTFSSGRNVEGVVAAAGAVMFSMVFLGLMCGFLLALRREHSAWWIVGVVLTTKSCDIGAYFTGRAIGRHKLIPWLSPGKTWEGLVGGVLTAALVGAALATASRLLPHAHDVIHPAVGAIAGVMFAIVGQFGDLTVSLFKRGAGLKDSSTILPGMGGILDVLDSPLMVAPVAYWLLSLHGT
ncbi:MAG: phosphatidate cytidylyltransferase [Phycisphaerales bacterium]|nr:phosphatidate cytidylyltransferase [Phycisphaerales bacterium]